MKQLLVLFLMVQSFGYARSIEPVLLELVETPLLTGELATVIRVGAGSGAFGGTCKIKVVFGRPESFRRPFPIQIDFGTCKWKRVRTLDEGEMRDIYELTEEARDSGVTTPKPLHCLAIPTHSVKMTADRGRVFLLSGSYPCGGEIRNISDAAGGLIQVLRDLRREFDALK